MSFCAVVGTLVLMFIVSAYILVITATAAMLVTSLEGSE